MDDIVTNRSKRTTGSIDRLDSGRYRVRICMADGTRISKGTYPTETEAVARLNELIIDN